MPFDPIDDNEPFGEDDLNSAPEAGESMHTRGQRKQAWSPDPGAETDERRNAYQRDAHQSLFAKFEQHGMPLHQPQFADVWGQVEGYIAEATNRAGYDRATAVNPADYVTQQNWRRGVGETMTERHFSPRARAQGHLLGAAAMFVASTPPLVPRSRVTDFRY